MHDEKSIERRWTIWECDCGALNREGAPGLQNPCPICNHPATIDCVEVMLVQDHLEALGEAQLEVAEERDRAEEERALRLRITDAVQEDRAKERAAEQKLETLRSGLEAEAHRLRNSALANGGGMEPYLDGCASTAIEASDRLQALLDASEDTEGSER
jgi:hypothetical protein